MTLSQLNFTFFQYFLRQIQQTKSQKTICYNNTISEGDMLPQRTAQHTFRLPKNKVEWDNKKKEEWQKNIQIVVINIIKTVLIENIFV